MQKTVKYTIFKTKWGYFGLAAVDNRLLRTCLPTANRKKVESHLLRNLQNPQYESGLFRKVQKWIIAYFEGNCINFKDTPVVIDGLGVFAKRVLTACRGIRFGQVVTYGQLAEMAGKPNAARAVGRVLAKNPLPLIIPCHRVACANGSLGGFSAIGGVKLKNRLLRFEQEYL